MSSCLSRSAAAGWLLSCCLNLARDQDAATGLGARVSRESLHVANSRQPAGRSTGAAVRDGPRHAGDPHSGTDAVAAAAAPAAGEPGHGATASLRRQPLRIVEGRTEGGYTGRFELICPDCGDHPYLDYSEVSARLQLLRGPAI